MYTQRLMAVCLAITVAAGLSASNVLVGQEKASRAKKTEEKRYRFAMQDQPWAKVMEWLVVETGLPFVSSYKPPVGKINITPPKASHPDGYTMGEIIDLVNDALAPSKFLLLRREAALTLIPADEAIPPELVRTVPPDDLRKVGRTELVRVSLPLRAVDPQELAPEVKKLLGPFGSVVAVGKALVLQDTAGNLKHVLRVIHELENAPATAFSYRCAHVRAAQAQKVLQDLLRGAGGAKGGLSIAVDQRTNTLFLSGAPERIAQARALLAKIDTAIAGQAPLTLGPPVLKTYAVPGGQADALVSILRKIFRTGEVEIAAVGKDGLLVWADPEDQAAIARHIASAAPPPATIEVIPLTATTEATRIADIVRSLFGKALVVEADANANALIVRGTKEQIAEVKRVLVPQSEPPSARVRVITLERGSAATLAVALEKMLAQMSPNPVRVVMPAEGRKPPKDGAAKPREREITLTAMGSKLIVSSDDPQALALVQELVRLLTVQAGEGDFEVIRLKNADAIAVARILDESFNGGRPSAFGKGRLGGSDESPARGVRLRVVPDPATNSLLLKASPLDMLTVRQLLLQLDVDQEAPGPRSRVLGPFKHAKADELAKVLREVYRDQAANFSATADTRTNSLVIRSAPALHEDIERLVKQLDSPKNP